MIEVKVTNDMFLTAREKSVEVGKLNNSILNGGGNLAGNGHADNDSDIETTAATGASGTVRG